MKFWSNQNLELFHGTTQAAAESILSEGIKPEKFRDLVDFGRGFYTTTVLPQAADWARVAAATRLARGGEIEKAAIVNFSVSRDALARLETLAFVRGGNDYWNLVTTCRHWASGTENGTPEQRHRRLVGKPYDVVVGPVAMKWSTSFKLQPNMDQLSFHTAEAFQLLAASSPRILAAESNVPA